MDKDPSSLIFQKSPEEERMPAIAAVTNLGPENRGAIGPRDVETSGDIMRSTTSSPEYHGVPTNCFCCVDGRTFKRFEPLPDGMVDPQTAGSLVITLGSARMMTTDSPPPLSSMTKHTTADIVAAKYEVLMHGDTQKGYDGCGAAFNQREVLRFNGEQADIIAPTVWTISELLGLDEWISREDVEKDLATGKQNAENDSLWDVTPAENTQLAIENGAKYVEVEGQHHEQFAVVTIDEDDVYNNQQLAHRNVSDDGVFNTQAFAIAMGTVKKAIFEIVAMNGGSERDAARLVAAAAAINVGTAKLLKNDDLEVGVLTKK